MTARRCARLLAVAVLAAFAGPGLHLAGGAAVQAEPPTVLSYRGFQFAEGVTSPTADKPQSKLWFADGSWWGLLATAEDGNVNIFELSDNHTWTDTSTVVDDRINSTADVLWDGSRLYVASRTADGDLLVSRFDYDDEERSWSRLGTPATVAGGGMASVTIDKDSRGRLWLTYVQEGQVRVAHTNSGDRAWSTPFVPPVSDPFVTRDDISALVSFDGKIGVMWSDQASDQFTFAVHDDRAADSVWSQEVASRGYLEIDDHLHLQTAPSSNGARVLTAVKTSLDNISGVPGSAEQIAVLVRSPNGKWKTVPAGTVADGHNRPLLLVDSSSEQLYLIATAHGQGIYYKRSPLDDIAFPGGEGEPLLTIGSGGVSDPTTSKAAVTSESGLVVLANAGGSRTYFHAEIDLPDVTADDTEAPDAPADVFTSVTAGCQVDLMWPPARDNVEVLRYTIERDGEELASTTDTGYTDLSAGCASTQKYAVAAVDTTGNVSRLTESAPVTTPDSMHRGSGIWLTGNSTATNDGGRTLTLPAPPSERGDLLIATIDAVGVPTVEAPAGWDLVRRDAEGNSLVKLTYTRVATGTEPSVTRWRLSEETSVAAVALSYRGVDTDDAVVEAVGQGNSSSTSVDTPSVVLPDDDAMVVGLFGVAGLVSVTPPPEMVGHLTQGNSAGARQRITSSTAEMSGVEVASGVTATASVAWPSIGQLLVLRPASSTQ
ncbi:MAG: hypothetical protein K0Q93_2094 [Nocardioidaceae bacterium]|nr:hypothetical protein [Nocardioidaceae bacterium]